jgi:hypothetical protein
VRDAKASLTGKRPRPPYGGRANLQKSDEGRRNCVPHGAISALGIGPVRGATLTGPTLRANLASRIAGRFARTDAKIRALTREGRWGGASLTGKRPYYALASLTGKRPRGTREGGRRPVRGTYKTSSIVFFSIKGISSVPRGGGGTIQVGRLPRPWRGRR